MDSSRVTQPFRMLTNINIRRRLAGEASVVRVARDERSLQWPTGTDHHARFFGARTIPRGSSLVGREV